MRLTKALNLFFFCLAVGVAVFLFFSSIQAANASDDCRGNKPCNNTDVDVHVGGDDIDITGGDVTVPVEVNPTTNVATGDVNLNSKSRALALSNSLGDVDISQCLGSTQWATPLFSKQKLVVNWPCLTEFYLRNAMYENAAMAICNTEVRKEYATETECRDAHPFKLMAPPPQVVEDEDEDEEYAEIVIEQMAIIEDQRQQMQAYNERLANLEKRRATPAKVVNQVGLTDEQRAALAQVFEK